ncbi:MAG: amino acid permease [Fervidicoccaceae archaeon]
MGKDIESIRKGIEDREKGLKRAFSQGQMIMMAIGSAIGTGLFLGSGFAIKLAGSGTAVSYVLGALIAYSVGTALAEMTKLFPSPGAFGNHAEIFISRYLGFLVKFMYWFAEAFAIGADLAAASIYMSYWFHEVSPVIWIVIFGAMLFLLNSISVNVLGAVEYALSTIKVSVILLFIIIGSYILLHPSEFGLISTTPFFQDISQRGFTGIWLATVVAIYSFIGVEVVGVTSGEARNPEKDSPRALRAVVILLTFLYVSSIIAIVNLVPEGSAGLTESPFVLVFNKVNIPAAASLVNFVILTAALSGANTNLYLTSRMLFSLARGGLAPSFLGKLNRFRSPFNALAASMVGVVVTTVLSYSFGSSLSYLIVFGVAAFGGIFTWMAILASHISFSLNFRKRGIPLKSLLGLMALMGVLISTIVTPGIEVTVPSGLIVIAIISIVYRLLNRGK